MAILALNTAARPFGDAAIAAMAIVSRLSHFTNFILIGFGQGFQPVCGFNYGAKLYDRVKRAFRFCVKVTAVFLVVLSVAEFFAAPFLIELFRRDSEVVRIGSTALRLQCLTFPLASWVTISNMMMQTTGKVFRASFLAAGVGSDLLRHRDSASMQPAAGDEPRTGRKPLNTGSVFTGRL